MLIYRHSLRSFRRIHETENEKNTRSKFQIAKNCTNLQKMWDIESSSNYTQSCQTCPSQILSLHLIYTRLAWLCLELGVVPPALIGFNEALFRIFTKDDALYSQRQDRVKSGRSLFAWGQRDEGVATKGLSMQNSIVYVVQKREHQLSLDVAPLFPVPWWNTSLLTNQKGVFRHAFPA